jgi:hypothetical protein
MKLVPEKLNEISFHRGQDPLDSMNIGKASQLKTELKAAGLQGNELDILPNFIIIPNKNCAYFQLDKAKEIAIRHMPEPYSGFANHLISISKSPHSKSALTPTADYIEDMYNSGISKEDMLVILDNYGNGHERGTGKIYLSKISRSKEEKKEEDENNNYVFIGYTDKVPVKVNGKTYYEDKFAVENMIKIDKYNPADLAQVSGMKIRARYQEHKYPDYGVYMLTIPKDMMDEENYYEIPPHLQDIVEKYKKKI